MPFGTGTVLVCVARLVGILIAQPARSRRIRRGQNAVYRYITKVIVFYKLLLLFSCLVTVFYVVLLLIMHYQQWRTQAFSMGGVSVTSHRDDVSFSDVTATIMP